MSGPRFSTSAFATNRWNVGTAAPPTAVDQRALDRERRATERRTASYKAKRIKAQLRPLLMRLDPHCADCGLLLQMITREAPSYACVMGTENPVLCCHDCANIRGKTHAKTSTVGEGVPA